VDEESRAGSYGRRWGVATQSADAGEDMRSRCKRKMGDLRAPGYSTSSRRMGTACAVARRLPVGRGAGSMT